MKLGCLELPSQAAPVKAGRCAGFTFTNLLTSSSIFLMVVAGIISSHVFGLKLVSLSQIKLGATQGYPVGIQNFRDQVRSARNIQVGQGNSQSFTEISPNLPQTGNALQIYPTDDPTQFMRYYVDSTAQQLKCLSTNGTLSSVFSAVSNPSPFTLEDYTGNVLTNRQRFCVVNLWLQFNSLPASGLRIGSGQYYTSYELRTKVARRSLD